MGWQQFPQPEGSTGIGVHLSSEAGGYSDDSLREAFSLGIRWAKVLSIIPQDRLVAVIRHGIYPIVRIYKDMNPWNRPLNGVAETQRIQQAMNEGGKPHWKPYIQIGNEGNLAVEWNEDGSPNRLPPENAPEMAAAWWYPIAASVINAGGIPITTPLSPGGNYNDWKWFVRFCRELKALGATRDFLERCAIGVHNYTNNKPLDWGKGGYKRWQLHDFNRAGWHGNEFVPGHEDSQGFCMYEWYHQAMLDICGAECAVLSCEGGTYPGNNDIRYRPPVDEGMHARYITSQMALMMGDTVDDAGIVNEPMPGVPDWYFCTAFWTWGTQPSWWEGDIRRLQVTKAAMRRMSIHPRKAPDVIVPTEPVEPEKPVYVDRLQVEMRQVGSGLVQGNVPAGAEVDVEFFGNHVRGRAGDKPELGAGGFEVLVHNEAREVVVSVSGCEPLRIQLAGRVPFVTVAPRSTPPEEKPAPDYVLELGFKELATKYPIRKVRAAGPLEYTPVRQHAVQEVTFIYGQKERQGLLVWHRQTGAVRLVSADPDAVFSLG
jgi:hypothetical protein